MPGGEGGPTTRLDSNGGISSGAWSVQSQARDTGPLPRLPLTGQAPPIVAVVSRRRSARRAGTRDERQCMSGNATYRYGNVAILSVCGVDAPHVVTSDEFDERLAHDLPAGGAAARPAGAAGRHPRAALVADGRHLRPTARRWPAPRRWPRRASTRQRRPADQHLGEPGAPRAVHGGRRARDARPAVVLPELRRGQRLPRLRQRHAAGRHHDRRRADRLRAGRRRRGRPAHPGGHPRPAVRRRRHREDVLAQFATLTLGLRRGGDGARPRRPAPGGAPVPGRRRCRAATEHHQLCVGDLESMHTDSKGLLDAGLALGTELWADAARRVRLGRTWTATSCTRSPRSTPRRCAGARHRPGPGPAHLPDPRQHRPGRGAVHPGAAGRLAAGRRPGAADGHRLRAERALRGDRCGEGRARPGRPSRRPCPGWTRPGPGWSPPRTRTGCRAPGTCWTTAREPVRGTLLCVHGNPTWSYLWRRLLAAGPARLAGGRRRPARHGLLRAHRPSRAGSRSGSTTSAR